MRNSCCYNLSRRRGLSLGTIVRSTVREFHQASSNACIDDDTRVSEIVLGPLSESSINDIVAKVLELPSDSSNSVSRLVFAKSHGIVFNALHYLHSLIDTGIVSIDKANQRINWSETDIQKLSEAEDQSVDELVRRKMESLPQFTKSLLQAASCIGDDVDVSTLLLVLDGTTDDITIALDIGVREQLLLYFPEQGRWKFVHDRIRSIANSCITDVDALSYQIGQRLWSQSPPIVLSASVCTIANLVNKGIGQVDDQIERCKIAALNLHAGEKAASLHSFLEAAEYIQTGINLLPGIAGWEEHYNLAISLYNTAADVELCNQNFDRVVALTSETLLHAKSFDDKLPAHVARIYAAGQNGSLNDALIMGIDLVRQLGVYIPSKPSEFAIAKCIVKTSAALLGKSDDALLSLPLMRDQRNLVIGHILGVIIPFAVKSGSPFLPIIATTLVQQCLRYGISNAGMHGFTLYSLVVARFSKQRCYRFGRLALRMVEKLRAREMIPCVQSVVMFECNYWAHPVKESFSPFNKCIEIGLSVGDVEYVCVASLFRGLLALFTGVELTQVQQYLLEASERMTRYGQTNKLQILDLHLHATAALLDGDEPLIKTIEEIAIGDHDNKLTCVQKFSWGAILAYYIGDYATAEAFVEKRNMLRFEMYSDFIYVIDQFYLGLIATAKIRSRSGKNSRRSNIKVCKRSIKMFKSWAKDCPDNFLNKQLLLEAELRSLKMRTEACSKTNNLYGRAYNLSIHQGFTHEAALACELAGNYMQAYNHTLLAIEYWKKAHSLYVKWGGIAKAAQLLESKGEVLQL